MKVTKWVELVEGLDRKEAGRLLVEFLEEWLTG